MTNEARVRLDDVLETIQNFRHEIAATFDKPECAGQRGQDRTDVLYDVYKRVEALRSSAIAALPVQVSGEPVAWLVSWHDLHGNSGVDAYTDQADARAAASNIEAYFTVKATATVTSLFASPPTSASQVLTEEEVTNLIEELDDAAYQYGLSGGSAHLTERVRSAKKAIIDRITNKGADR